MDLRKLILTKNRCYKIGKKTKKKGVMWHSTGANNPNLKRYVGPDDGALGKNSNNNHWNAYQPGGRNVCVHAFIGLLKNGKVATYQTLPWEMRGWHAGGTGNNDYIGFEICEDNLKDKSYFEKVYKEAVELTAYLCELHGWNPKGKNVIICHAEGHKLGIASNHGDVLHWFKKHGKTMDDVRNDVAELMEKKEEAPKKDEAPKKETTVQSSKSNSIKAWQEAAIKDGFKFPKYGADGIWGTECESVAEKAIVKMRISNKKYIYKYPNLTKIVQKAVGAAVDGDCGPKTDKAIIAYQEKYNLVADGDVGLKTWKKILGV